ncbi:MAG: protein disulfide-isomerase precursor [Sporothrix epigloea]
MALVAFGSTLVSGADVSDVHQLKTDTFNEFIKTNEIVLAEFFAPWCGHCKALAPEYEEAATTLKEKNIKLAKVDCTEEAELCQTYGVEGYPTLKIFRGTDNVVAYKGPRKAAAITSYMIKQSLPAVSTVTRSNLDEFKKADKVVLVAYFKADDKASNETFTKVAEKLRDNFPFGASSDAELAEAEGITVPSIVLYKDFDEGKAVFTEKFDDAAIEKFAMTASMPLIGEVGPETYSGYMSAGIPLAYIFAESAEERKELAGDLKSVAEAHRGVINFATIDAKAFGAHAANLNLPTDKFPSFAIQETVKNQKFPFDIEAKITKDAIKTFVDSFVAGEIKPSIKSEPIPEKQEGVTVVVAHNYNDIVLDDTKDVLLEFYAPWCGHCKSLAPKYDDLAAQYAASQFKDKVVIAKVDATANDVPDEIQGFPTIKLFAAGKKDAPVTYSGPRTVEDLISFIKENGSYGAEPIPADEEDDVAESSATSASSSTKTDVAKEQKSKHDEL